MSEQEAIEQLKKEGFAHVYTWSDSPGAFYDKHEHPNVTAHIILKGSMTLTIEGIRKDCSEGDRIDVPANTEHLAQIGPNGCTYVNGE